MNNYFIIGKVNEGKSHLFNLFSKDHKTISNPKENTTVDIIRKKISHNNYNYFLFDTPGFYNLKEFILLNNRIKSLKLEFASCFKNSDQVILCPVYAAGELTDKTYNKNKFAQLIIF